MVAIPRMRLTLSLQEIIRFFRNLLLTPPESRHTLLAEFERAFAARYDLPPGICVCKARVALYLLLTHMNVKPGGEVLITAIHVADFVNMIRLAGFKPVVVDLEKQTYHVDYDDLEQKITSKTAAMFITHLSGYATDMAKVTDIAARHKIPLIEDCSQAISSTFKSQRVGTFGDAAIFSLSLAKPVSTLSGGMILSRHTPLLDAIRKDVESFSSPKVFPLFLEALKNIILHTAVSPFIFSSIVFPLLRLTEPLGDFFAKYQKTNKTVIRREQMPKEFFSNFSWQQAVMGLSQLESLENRERRRTEYGLHLHAQLSSHPTVIVPTPEDGSHNTFWLFPVLVKEPDRLKRFLAQHGVDSSKFLLSVLSREEVFTDYRFTCENAEYIKDHTVFIPMYPFLGGKELNHILDVIAGYPA